MAQNIRRAPSSRTLMGMWHARVVDEKFIVTQNGRFAPSSRAITGRRAVALNATEEPGFSKRMRVQETEWRLHFISTLLAIRQIATAEY